jgi:hypothetical protein
MSILNMLVLAAAATWTPVVASHTEYKAYIVISTTWTVPGSPGDTEGERKVFQVGRDKYTNRQECQRDLRSSALIRGAIEPHLTDFTSAFSMSMHTGLLVNASLTLRCAADRGDL